MRIDFVIGSLRAGGAERVVVNLANYLSSQGHEVRILIFHLGGKYEVNKGVQIICFTNGQKFLPTLFRAVISLIKFYKRKNNRPDVINSHINLMGFALILPKWFYKIKIISSEHSNHLNVENRFLNKILWDYLYKYFDAITILTSFDYKYFSKRNNRVVVMGNPCSFKPILKSPKRDSKILAVGSMKRYKEKGFDSLLKITSEVLKSNKKWKLQLVGGGAKGIEKLKKIAKLYGIEEKVEFLGFRDDIPLLMKKAEVFVLSSKYEGLPMALLEAMSQGMSCISYDCISGPSDIIKNEYSGLLVENQNEKKMTEGINRLLNDSALRKKLRENSVLAASKFSIQAVGDKWIRLAESVTDQNQVI